MYQLKTTQLIPASLPEVWDFMSSPRNLQRITPDYMGFEIKTSDLPDKMYAGMIIAYTVRPLLGIGMEWVTEITQIHEPFYFVDEQRVGPYAMWHHEHHLKATEGGVLMSDIVSYQPPMGFLGKMANVLFIRRQLKEIFDYRFQVVEAIFGKPQDAQKVLLL